MLLLRPLMVAIAQPTHVTASMLATASQGRTLLDFANAATADQFAAVDDRIMGGASRSRIAFDGDDGATCFEGDLVVEGGGFASVRYGKPFTLPADCEALTLEASGDGRRGYKLTLQTAVAAQGVSYQYLLPFDEHDGDRDADGFCSLRIPLSAFKPTLRGRPAPDAPALRASDVCGLGLMLSRYEVAGGVKESIEAGPFRLRLRRLATAQSELAINGRRWAQKR